MVFGAARVGADDVGYKLDVLSGAGSNVPALFDELLQKGVWFFMHELKHLIGRVLRGYLDGTRNVTGDQGLQ